MKWKFFQEGKNLKVVDANGVTLVCRPVDLANEKDRILLLAEAKEASHKKAAKVCAFFST